MKKELANHPNIKLVDTVYGNDKDQESFDKTSAALLQSHPDLKGIISPTTVKLRCCRCYLSTSKAKARSAPDWTQHRTRCGVCQGRHREGVCPVESGGTGVPQRVRAKA